jgi:hypothetical protein
MLFGYSKYNDEHCDRHYVDARRKIDILCGLIVSGRLSREEALRIYEDIENDFVALDPSKADLFGMIYKNRVNRLCDQFCRK